MQLVLEADTTYRARQLATGGARLLFADIHPNLPWSEGVLSIGEMIGHHTVAAAGRGLLLIPSIFAYKPVPPLDPGEPPSLGYPSRGIGTLWSPPPQPEAAALVDLLGRTRALMLEMLAEPLPTIEIARRLRVTPSAVSRPPGAPWHLPSQPRPRRPPRPVPPEPHGRPADQRATASARFPAGV